MCNPDPGLDDQTNHDRTRSRTASPCARDRDPNLNVRISAVRAAQTAQEIPQIWTYAQSEYGRALRGIAVHAQRDTKQSLPASSQGLSANVPIAGQTTIAVRGRPNQNQAVKDTLLQEETQTTAHPGKRLNLSQTQIERPVLRWFGTGRFGSPASLSFGHASTSLS